MEYLFNLLDFIGLASLNYLERRIKIIDFLQDSSIKSIIDCLVAKKPAKQYNESVRIFSLTLHSLSSRAYNYVREKFHKNLPHVTTITKWYANSRCNGESGVSQESINTLRNLVGENKEELYVTLSFDEMNIRRNCQWSDVQKKFIGQITYGSIPKNAQYLPIAHNAIVFMVNGVNSSFNLPVAFHFINCLHAHEKAALLTIVLKAVSETSLKVLAVIFDGLGQNFTVCRLLGASFEFQKNFHPYILNPYNGEEVLIILDPPHMVKLIRNCIGNKKTLYHTDGTKIEWKFYEALEELRAKSDIVTHKITKQHILFEKNIMNVSLATQLLSESAAKSMETFLSLPHTKNIFEGCEATVEFTRRFNNLFDIFNSKSDSKFNIFKSPIKQQNKDQIFGYLDETINYIMNLRVESPQGESVLNFRRKTAFIGFIINITNLKQIYLKYVEQTLNQDPLENLFGRIRTTCLGKYFFFRIQTNTKFIPPNKLLINRLNQLDLNLKRDTFLQYMLLFIFPCIEDLI